MPEDGEMKRLQQGVLEHIEEVHVTLLQTETEVLVRPIGIVDENFNLNIFLDALLENILQEGEHIRVVGAEAAPGAFCFQKVFRIQIHKIIPFSLLRYRRLPGDAERWGAGHGPRRCGCG